MKQTTYYIGAAIAFLVQSVLAFILAVRIDNLYLFYISGFAQTMAIIAFIAERFCHTEIFIRNIAKAIIKDKGQGNG